MPPPPGPPPPGINKQMTELKQELRARSELNRLRQKQLHAEHKKIDQQWAQSEKRLHRKMECVEKQLQQASSSSQAAKKQQQQPSAAAAKKK